MADAGQTVTLVPARTPNDLPRFRTADQVLTHLVGRSGLLRQPTMETIDFVHRTFQDYLGAKAAIEAHDFPLLVNNAHDDQWEDVLRMAVAHARPAESADLLRRLVERGDAENQRRPRLHLLAAASMHYTTEVAPDTRHKVTARAAALMPPRTLQEANTLSALGPGILDLLPRTADGLPEDEITAVFRTAAATGGDQAYAYLQHFVPTVGLSVPRHELMMGWTNFEAADYARDILRLTRDHLHVTVQTRAQFNALPLLTPIEIISFELTLTPSEILEHLSPEHTTSLSLRYMQEPSLESLSFIRSLAALRSLALGPSTPVDGLHHLAGLPLQELNLLDLPEGFSFQALNNLPQLRELLLYTVLPWRTLHTLPASPTLTRLWLGAQIEASITGITQWAMLEDVVVNRVMDAVEWAELAELPQLTSLQVTDADFANTPVMATVNRLGLSVSRSDIHLDLIPDRFPNLEQLRVNALADVACDLVPSPAPYERGDSPLQRRSHLAHRSGRVRSGPIDALPPSTAHPEVTVSRRRTPLRHRAAGSRQCRHPMVGTNALALRTRGRGRGLGGGLRLRLIDHRRDVAGREYSLRLGN
ncbi:hypothetical protein [Streptomyces virginiae]|uniref:hypothetical protein n=1 Tax=Streptomyces virginiae TaxID=1961 RepID=UPI0034543D26